MTGGQHEQIAHRLGHAAPLQIQHRAHPLARIRAAEPVIVVLGPQEFGTVATEPDGGHAVGGRDLDEIG